jgi:hypothetical protein
MPSIVFISSRISLRTCPLVNFIAIVFTLIHYGIPNKYLTIYFFGSFLVARANSLANAPTNGLFVANFVRSAGDIAPPVLVADPGIDAVTAAGLVNFGLEVPVGSFIESVDGIPDGEFWVAL